MNTIKIVDKYKALSGTRINFSAIGDGSILEKSEFVNLLYKTRLCDISDINHWQILRDDVVHELKDGYLQIGDKSISFECDNNFINDVITIIDNDKIHYLSNGLEEFIQTNDRQEQINRAKEFYLRGNEKEAIEILSSLKVNDMEIDNFLRDVWSTQDTTEENEQMDYDEEMEDYLE